MWIERKYIFKLFFKKKVPQEFGTFIESSFPCSSLYKILYLHNNTKVSTPRTLIFAYDCTILVKRNATPDDFKVINTKYLRTILRFHLNVKFRKTYKLWNSVFFINSAILKCMGWHFFWPMLYTFSPLSTYIWNQISYLCLKKFSTFTLRWKVCCSRLSLILNKSLYSSFLSHKVMKF